ncbi:unnamed protein product [Lactuca saligna]|uniref:Uncharacterized protein n=1 Tax=Lactuca saligna TaxID=75948 RepID=A0AA35YK98_LACSI|nr:unnamed protein product [Lactuca saligna]
MEVNNQQHEDMPEYDMKYEKDDGTQVYDSDTEDGEGNNIDYNSNSDSDEEIQNPVPTRSNRKRVMTRMPKLKTVYLGDLLRENVGLSAFGWKKVTSEVKEKLWEELTDMKVKKENLKMRMLNSWRINK